MGKLVPTVQGRRPGRPRSDQVQRDVLEAVARLLLDGGLPAVNIEAVAAAAGVSKATIYRWWPSRGALLLDGFLAAVPDTLTLPDGVTDAQDALRRQLKSLIVLLRDTPAGPLLRAITAQAASDPDIATALRERWLAPRRAAAAEVLRAAVSAGRVRPEVDLDACLDMLFAPVYYRLMYRHSDVDDELADVLVNQLWIGILA